MGPPFVLGARLEALPSRLGEESFGHVFLEHGPNGCWSLRVAQNAIDRLGGKATKLVFVLRYGPGGGANKAKSFRLFIQRYIAG